MVFDVVIKTWDGGELYERVFQLPTIEAALHLAHRYPNAHSVKIFEESEVLVWSHKRDEHGCYA